MSNARTMRHLLGGSADTFKGLLILVVVLDHNDVAHALFPATFHPLTFHVLGFLLLPFVLGAPRWSRGFVLDRLARYGVPQFWILTVSALLLWLIHGRSLSLAQIARDYLVALLVGSGPVVKQSSGFLAYWFLPTLLGLVVVLAAYRALAAKARVAAFLLFLVAHLMLVASYFPIWQWIPFGLPIVANLFVLGLLFERLVDSKVAFRLRWMFPIAFILSYGGLVYTNAWLEIAILEMAPITRTALFITQDVAGITGVLTVLLIADRLKSVNWIASIGALSLMVYLLHPLAYAAFDVAAAIAERHFPVPSNSPVFGVMAYCVALGTSWIGARLIARSALLRSWLTPRELLGWRPIAMLDASSTSPGAVASRIETRKRP